MHTFYTIQDIKTFCHRSPTGRYSLIIDAVLLIPLLIGLFDKSYLSKCSLTSSSYKDKDFDLIIEILRFFKPQIIVTPNIVTEVYNRTDNKIDGEKLHYFFTKVVDKLRNSEEHHIPLHNMLGLNFEILKEFGFADISIIQAARDKQAVILTDDRPLYDKFWKTTPMILYSNMRSTSLVDFMAR